jgi:type I restriction enzyme, R subunit
LTPVEKYAQEDAWRRLDADPRHELSKEVSGLPTSKVDDDLTAKQFDLTVYRTQLALLRSDADDPRSRMSPTVLAKVRPRS